METKEALTRMVKAGRLALDTDNGLRALGYSDTPYFTIYGDIADAVYYLLGEKTGTFDESVTNCALSSPDFTHDQRVSLLMHEYEKNIMEVQR